MGQWNEWDCKGELPWHLLQYDRHHHLQACIRALNHFYQSQSSLWEKEFEWIDASDSQNSVISYLRGNLACVHNFTPAYFPSYFIPLAKGQALREVFNTDQTEFGGSGKINSPVEKVPGGFNIQLAPLATMIFEVL